MTVTENSLWQFLDQGLGRGLLFLFYASIPLLIEPEDYGSFVFLQAMMVIVAEPLMGFGLDAIVIGQVARGSHAVVRPALLIRMLLIAGTGLLAVTICITTHSNLGVIVCLWIQLAMLSIERLVFSYYRGIEWMKMEGVLGAMQKSLALPILGVLRRLGVGGALLPAASLALMAAIGGLLMCILYRQRVLKFVHLARRSSHQPAVGVLLRQGTALGVAASVSILYFRIDSVMLAALADEKAVAMYNAAYRFMEATFIVPALVTAAIFPRLARPAESGTMLRTAAFSLAAVGILVMALAYLWGKPMLGALYGPAYGRAGETLAILAFAIAPVYLGFLLTQALIAQRRENAYLRITVLGVALNVALNLLLIPTHRELGAAFATVATELAVVVTAAIALRQSGASSIGRGEGTAVYDV